MNTREIAELRESADILGLEPTESMLQQVEVIAEALDIYQERSKVRGETWAEFDHHDCIHHMSSKLARLKNAAQLLAALPVRDDLGPGAEVERVERVDALVSAMEDDALDMINYAAFLVRHLTGRKPVRAIG